MQSGYGAGVSEFQQFIMDGGFTMAAASPQQQQAHAHAAAAAAQAGAGQELGAPFRYQPLHHHAMHQQQHHHHHHAPPPPQMPAHFAHFGGGGAGPAAAAGGIPFTQQLLHHQAAQHHQHHLQLFNEQQHHQHQHKPQPPARWAPQQQHQQHQQIQHPHHHLGLDVEAAAVPETSRAASGGSVPPGVPPFLAAAMNFKLAVDPGGGSGATGGTDDAMNDGAGGAGSGMMLHGGGDDDEAATESRLRRWTGEEETSIKEPSWYVPSPPTAASTRIELVQQFMAGTHANFFLCSLLGSIHSWRPDRQRKEKGSEGEKSATLLFALLWMLGGGEIGRAHV